MPLVLTAVALGALITSCGGNVVPRARLEATAMAESHLEPYAIGVNADHERNFPHMFVHSDTAAEAIVKAVALMADGRHLDFGLMGISDRQLAHHGLTIQSAFEPCKNIAAGAAHLAEDWAWVMASRRYNCGRTDCGVVYADNIQRVIAATSNPVPAIPIPRGSVNPFTKPAATGRDLVFVTRKDYQ